MKRKTIEILRARREQETANEQLVREPRQNAQAAAIQLPTWPERGAIDELFREAARWR